MTVTEWIGHRAWRLCISKRFPPDMASGVAFASFHQHIDGTEVFYVRGVAKIDPLVDGPLPEIVAKEIFSEACSWCVGDFATGTLRTSHIDKPLHPDDIWDTEFCVRWSTTNRVPRKSDWGKPCRYCRRREADSAFEAARKRCEQMGFEMTGQLKEVK
jgi:hypothetical protein